MIVCAHLLAYVLLAEKEAGTQVLFGDILVIHQDELADTGEDDVLDRLGSDALEIHY